MLAERLPSSMASSKQTLLVILLPIVLDMITLEHAVLVDGFLKWFQLQ
jgi:hypothetical protein